MWQMLSVPRFSDTFDFDSKTMKLPDELNNSPLPPITPALTIEANGPNGQSHETHEEPSAAPLAISIRRHSDFQRRLEHLPLWALLGVIKMQSIFRRRLARRKAEDIKRCARA